MPGTRRRVNILAISDEVEELLYSPAIRARFAHVDLVLSCGDLPPYYLDYIVSMLNVPVYSIRGNHDGRPEYTENGPRTQPTGAIDLHRRVVNEDGLLIGGLEGSLRYNNGACQYTETQMRLNVARMIPRLLWNKLRYGRYLDILITHAPPRHIHDQPDRCHRGFEVFRWFLRAFRPSYHLHGHIHIYNNRTVRLTRFQDTLVLNAFGHRELQVEVPSAARDLVPSAT
jgi:Icc-related predicted phosphoesterase